MRSVSSSLYNKEYYLNTCLGFEEFGLYHGKKAHKRVDDLLSILKLKKGMRVLDIGCGRGDAAFYMARKGAEVIGIDYSKDAIELANQALKEQHRQVRRRVKFLLTDAKSINFGKNYFDFIIAIDFFEHLYKEELEIVMKRLSWSLKPGGTLLVHTEVNKVYLDFTHPFYIFPVSSFLIWINKVVTKNTYPGLPKDPRNDFHKKQHVNEPTYFYLKKLFKRHQFKGRIIQNVGLLKPPLSWKDIVYNIFVLFYPISKYIPLIYLFATDYTCIMKNAKNK